MHARRETAGHQHRVALDAAGPADLAGVIDLAQGDCLDPEVSLGAEDGGAREDFDARGTRRVGKAARDLRADIGDGGDGRAARSKIERGLISRIAGGDDDHAPSDQYAESVEIGLRRTGEHDARAIVAREDQRPLDGTGRQHHLPGAYLPQTLARQLSGAAPADDR